MQPQKLLKIFMLAANETIAECYFYWQQVPFLYRNHEKPDSDRMTLQHLLHQLWLFCMEIIRRGKYIKEIQKLLEK